MGVYVDEYDDGCVVWAASDEVSGYFYAADGWGSVYGVDGGGDWGYSLRVGWESGGCWLSLCWLFTGGFRLSPFARRPGDSYSMLVFRLWGFWNHLHYHDYRNL